ncbi:MAG: proline--tRNA ligase [Actinobacteria bacterium]|jgi:prolyl-tRNA synthetase|nr:proline--tRNA ligase [Actinomycetota bacterium]
MRATALFMPTVKEDPADAEAVSHKLMVRGGFVRQFASGIYIMLPLGWRVMQRICGVIREEMDGIGAVEMSMPTMHPADVWQATGRYESIGQEMFRLQDRGGRDMVLAMTHEEVFTWLASRELRSYRDLPQIWYQLQLKFRDEPRPKGGVLRVREFLMKDSYSFDIDEAGLDKSYEKHIGAYDRIFARCGVDIYRVESDSGFMGGAQAHEYIAPSAAGEDRIALCPSCGYAANVELARSVALPPAEAVGAAPTGEATDAPREVGTPGRRTIEEVSTYLGIAPSLLIKALVYVAGDRPVMALVRGDHSLHESKLARYLKTEVRAAQAEEVRAATGAEVGFVGPVGLPAGTGLRVVADESLRPAPVGAESPWPGPRGYAAGANKTDAHLVGVVVGRDFQPEYADLREAQEGDGCPQCGRTLIVEQGIEVGNIFKLGTKYSMPLGATVLDETGRERTMIMGSYGIGPARIAAAAVEQRSDDRGIVWPKAIAPFDVHIVQVQAKDQVQIEVAASLHDSLAAEGWEVLWDDRDERPGSKFADAELIGCPVRVTVGKGASLGMVEVEARRGGDRLEVAVGECGVLVRRLWEACE